MAIQAELHQFAKYGVVGLLTNGLLYLAFLVLLMMSLTPVVSAGLCYFAGVLMSYFLNKKWTFSSDESHAKDIPKFVFAYSVGLVITLVSISLLTRWMPAEVAQLLNIGITAVGIYSILKLVRFGL